MKTVKINRNLHSATLIVAIILSSFSFWGSTRTFAQAGDATIQQIRAMKFDHTGISQPYGLVFSPSRNAFLVVDGAEWKASEASTNFAELTPIENRPGSVRLAAGVQDPINMAYDNKANRLLVLQSKANQLLVVEADASGTLDTSTMTRENVRDWGLQNPQGLAVDSASGDLFILDAAGPRILHVTPNSTGNFSAGNVSTVDLQASGI